jgi:hypothetical protein
VNNEVLTVIGTGPTLLQRVFDSSGRLLEMGINQIYGTCTDLYDDDIIPSVMLCAGVPDGGEKREASGLFGKAESAKEGIG